MRKRGREREKYRREAKTVRMQKKEKKGTHVEGKKKKKDMEGAQERGTGERACAQKTEMNISCRLYPNTATTSFRVF